MLPKVTFDLYLPLQKVVHKMSTFPSLPPRHGLTITTNRKSVKYWSKYYIISIYVWLLYQ